MTNTKSSENLVEDEFDTWTLSVSTHSKISNNLVVPGGNEVLAATLVLCQSTVLKEMELGCLVTTVFYTLFLDLSCP